MASPCALLTNGEGRATVAACRSLHAAGYRVSVVSAARPAASHWSRACQERLILADPVERPAAFIRGLVDVVRNANYSVLVPGSDGALMAISAAREELEPHIKIGLPSHAAVEASLDKLRLIEAAALAGLTSPTTFVCDDAEEASAAARQLGFPVILKPARAILDNGATRSRPSTRVVFEHDQLRALLPAYGPPSLVQQREQGGIYSCAGIMVRDGLLALVTSRYRRTWPPDAGEVAYSETVETPPDLAGAIELILCSLGWEGLFEVELIRRTDGSFAAIDLNPRLYGSLALAVAAGVALPALWCDWLLHGAAERTSVRPGVMYRWEEGDLRHLLWQLRRGRLGSAAEVLIPHRGVVHPNFRLSDPGPLVARSLQLARRAREKYADATVQKSRPVPSRPRETRPDDF